MSAPIPNMVFVVRVEGLKHRHVPSEGFVKGPDTWHKTKVYQPTKKGKWPPAMHEFIRIYKKSCEVRVFEYRISHEIKRNLLEAL